MHAARRAAVAAWTPRVAFLAVLAFIAVNALLIWRHLPWLASDALGIDFRAYAVDPMQPYATDGFRYPPLTAWVLAPFVAAGFGIWTLLHFLSLLLIPDRRTALLLGVSIAFYLDWVLGNTVTFTFVFAAVAVSGSRWGTWGFLIMCALFPRPFMLPVAAWLVWRHPEWRAPAVAVAGVALLSNLATGQMDEYIAMLRTWSSIEFDRYFFSPVAIGPLWLPLALAVTAIAVWKDRPGIAAMTIQPYIGFKYAMFLLLEFVSPRERASADAPGIAPDATGAATRADGKSSAPELA